jgi:hypothetical protein
MELSQFALGTMWKSCAIKSRIAPDRKFYNFVGRIILLVDGKVQIRIMQKVCRRLGQGSGARMI